MDRDDWISDQIDNHWHHYHDDFSDEQLSWLEYIWDVYADDEGYVDWDRSGDHDTAWYILMSEVYGLDDDTIDRYSDS